jgi:hypothetical protein
MSCVSGLIHIGLFVLLWSATTAICLTLMQSFHILDDYLLLSCGLAIGVGLAVTLTLLHLSDVLLRTLSPRPGNNNH